MVGATHYQSSRGLLAIADMAYPHIANAIAKLEREGAENDALPALRARRDAMDAERAASGDPAPSGHNAPPPDETPPAAAPEPGTRPFEAIDAHVRDLYAEAKNWMDGEPIANQGQADAVARLLDMLRQAHSAADAARVLENEPFDTGKAEVQVRYAPLIADTKAVKGMTVRAIEACRLAATAWLRKVEAEQAAEAARLRKIADDELAAAQAKLREAQATTDLRAVEEAEDIFAQAVTVDRAATRAEGAKAHAHGDGRATGLRDHWIAKVADPTEALRWAWREHRDELQAFALHLAQKDVSAGKRTLPGFTIENERRV